MECIGPIVVLVAVVLQVVTAVRKNQEQARRRAMQGDAPEPPTRKRFEMEMEAPRPRRTVLEPEPDGEETPPLPQRAPKPPTRRLALPATVQIGEVKRHRRGIRLNQSRARAAIVLSEILGPPVSLR